MESKTQIRINELKDKNPQMDLLGFANDEEVTKQFVCK